MHNDNFPRNSSPLERPSNPAPHKTQTTQDHKTFGNEPEIKDPPNPHQPREYEVTVSKRKSTDSRPQHKGNKRLQESEVNQPKDHSDSDKTVPPSKSAP